MANTPQAAIPPDNVNNKLTVANPDDPQMRHISVAGGTYTILVAGEETVASARSRSSFAFLHASGSSARNK
jgi:hypothetical protein